MGGLRHSFGPQRQCLSQRPASRGLAKTNVRRKATRSFSTELQDSSRQESLGLKTVIKICGVTSPEDARLAAEAGADMIGMILWPKAKRAVSTDIAKAIATVARDHGAKAVGVFVDESAAVMASVCDEAGIEIAQLHGAGARDSLLDLPAHLQVIYVMHADVSGVIQTPLPQQLAEREGRDLSRPVEWIVVDGLQGGSGETFSWRQLKPPPGSASRHGWLLAGGLTPDNAAEAVRIARPTGVDVSSGVAGPDGIRKDPARIAAFVQAVRSAL